MTVTKPRNLQTTESEICGLLLEKFNVFSNSGLPKHIRIRNAILELISERVLVPGNKIPSEQLICQALSISLGTVQRSLGDLSNQGVLQREHGRGTFVTAQKPAIDQVWQFRFKEPGTGRNLPVYTKFLRINDLVEDEFWEAELMPDSKGHFEILRIFNIDDQFWCYGTFILGRTRFTSLRDDVEIQQDSINLKRLIAEKYSAPTLRVSQKVKAAEIPSEVCEHIKIPPQTSGLMYQVVGFTQGDQPLSFQTIWIPPSKHMLDLTYSKKAVSSGLPMR